MLKPRIIPCLLIHNGGVVKTEQFKNPKYIGDPINTARIFNEKNVDELMVLDIDASVNNVSPNFELIAKLASECRMPLCYGGGIRTTEHAVRLVSMGVEKIALSSAALEDPSLITRISETVGSQSVVAVLDVRKRRGLFLSGYEVCTHNSKISHKYDPSVLALKFQEAGAGEIVINSVDRDGLMQGFDIKLASEIKKVLKIPLTVLGGAGSLENIANLFEDIGLVGAAVGSLFVFKGKYRAVLINYPSPSEKSSLFRNLKYNCQG
mgnify:CR=1 FL=1|tara:strand:- start:1091 stop:1885 length:795 start_codon:yes stop_codon:yes gene_type:complete